MTPRILLAVAALNGFLAVAAGAMGAHALQKLNLTAQQAGWFQTAVTYHGLHALALMGCAALIASGLGAPAWTGRAAWLFVAGLVMFCGTLYLMALTGARPHAIVPIGGLAFLGGWLCLAVAAVRA